jgi:hypothetical protein
MIYTSTDTNKTYSVVPDNSYGWFRYSIYDEEKEVQFALTEDQISTSVKHYEFPGWDGWTTSRFD